MQVLKSLPRIEGRPGASLPPMDFKALEEGLRAAHADDITPEDVMSAAMYPKVFQEFKEFTCEYSSRSSYSPALYRSAVTSRSQRHLEPVAPTGNKRRSMQVRTRSPLVYTHLVVYCLRCAPRVSCALHRVFSQTCGSVWLPCQETRTEERRQKKQLAATADQ